MTRPIHDWPAVKVQWLDWCNRRLGSDQAFAIAHGINQVTCRTHFAEWRRQMRAELQIKPPQPTPAPTPIQQLVNQQPAKSRPGNQTDDEEGFKAGRSSLKSRALERLKEIMDDRSNPAQSVRAALEVLKGENEEDSEPEVYAGMTDEALMTRLLALTPAALKLRTEKTIQQVVVPQADQAEENSEEKTLDTQGNLQVSHNADTTSLQEVATVETPREGQGTDGLSAHHNESLPANAVELTAGDGSEGRGPDLGAT